MITDLKPYPAMKDSGLPWMGAVPEHSNTRPLRHWVTINAEVLPETTDPDCVFRYVDIGSVGTGTLTQKLQRLRFAGAPSRARRIVHNGDTLVSTVRTYLKAIYFVHGEADELVCSTGFAVLTARVGTIPKFVSYLARSNAFTDRVTADSVGIAYPAVAEGRLGSFHVAVPPLSEQAAIVRYLDHVNGRIRRYISAKQKLITLLEEQKQAIIHQAVTGQIDVQTGQPYPAYKGSGVEWLGNIPEHWERCRLRNVVSEVTTGSRGWSSYASDTGPLFIRVANLNRGSLQLRFDDMVRLNLPNTSEVTRTRIEAGDLLVSVTAYSGSVGVAPEEFEEAYVNQHVARCQPRSGPSSQWLGYVLLSTVGQTHGQMSLYGGTKDGLSLDDVKNYPILLPPRCEQNQLVLWTERELSSLVKLGESAKRQIDLLREYRTRLIADVVTGKLDVRKAAARLPDEAEKPEPIGEDEEWSEAVDDDIELPEVLH